MHYNRNKCTYFAGHFDGRADQAVRCRAHCPTKHVEHQKQHHVPYSLSISINGTFLLIHRYASTLWAFQYVFFFKLLPIFPISCHLLMSGRNTFGTCFGETGLKIRPDMFRHDNCEQKRHVLLCKMSPASHFFLFEKGEKNNK